MSQILIKDGIIYDGSGQKPYYSDLLVVDNKIHTVGVALATENCEVINACGHAVAPGFIDVHTHADTAVFYDRQNASSLLQGVTTEIVGLCGLGFSPLSDEQFENYIKYSTGIFHDISSFHPDFSTLGNYLQAVECGSNIASAVAHSAIRIKAAGFQNVPLEGKRLDDAKRVLRSSLEDGAVGFSTGLTYFPHYYGDTKELIELCSVAAEYDVPFLVHHRTVFANQMAPCDPTWEAMEIARKTGVKLHVLHTKTSWPETAGEIFNSIEPYYSKAKDDGVDISFELYPYHAGCGYGVAFIPWEYAEGGYYEVMKRLGDPPTARKMAEKLSQIWEEISGNLTFVLTHLKRNVEFIGHSFPEVAAYLGLSVPEMIIKLLYDNDLAVGFRGVEPADPDVKRILDKDIMDLLTWPNYMVGSDSILVGEKLHPRSFGTFPKVIRLAREMNYPLEMIINRITKLPAARFHLGQRGEIKEGKIADIVIFDPLKITDTATWDLPRNSPVGIPFVIVDGKIAVRNEKPTGLLVGRGLKRSEI